MTPDEWAEVFKAGADTGMTVSDPPALALRNVLQAMQQQCEKIAECNKEPRLKEDHFMGKPVSDLTYEEAIRFRHWLLSSDRQWISETTSREISRIIAEGPEIDRSPPIRIVPPTIIEGGQPHGAP